MQDSAALYKYLNRGKLGKLKNDDYYTLLTDMVVDYYYVDSLNASINAQLDALQGDYVDGSIQALGGTFIPDANSTLRFTYGKVKGYSPGDAVWQYPVSTLDGMAEKDGQAEDYVLNQEIKSVIDQNPKAAEQPVCILYNLDTTGGNSGSPVFDADGNLYGLNFDRAYQATVNDYAWNSSYSRSIGLSASFLVWYIQNVARATSIIGEFKIIK